MMSSRKQVGYCYALLGENNHDFIVMVLDSLSVISCCLRFTQAAEVAGDVHLSNTSQVDDNNFVDVGDILSFFLVGRFRFLECIPSLLYQALVRSTWDSSLQ